MQYFRYLWQGSRKVADSELSNLRWTGTRLRMVGQRHALMQVNLVVLSELQQNDQNMVYHTYSYADLLCTSHENMRIKWSKITLHISRWWCLGLWTKAELWSIQTTSIEPTKSQLQQLPAPSRVHSVSKHSILLNFQNLTTSQGSFEWPNIPAKDCPERFCRTISRDEKGIDKIWYWAHHSTTLKYLLKSLYHATRYGLRLSFANFSNFCINSCLFLCSNLAAAAMKWQHDCEFPYTWRICNLCAKVWCKANSSKYIRKG